MFANRFTFVNGKKIQSLRLQCGWTQRDLARIAGYSVRVIRKAEATGSLKLQTVNDLSHAFQSRGIEIASEDLIIDQTSVAKEIVDSFDNLGYGMLDRCGKYLALNLEINCVANRTKFPFAGSWKGAGAMQSFLSAFFSQFTRKPGTLAPTYLVAKDRVVARFDETVYTRGHEVPQFFVNLHLHFNDFIVVRIDYEANFQALSDHLDLIDAVVLPRS